MYNLLTWRFCRGDIYLADLNPFTGSEQGGIRPVLLLQNNTGNKYCPTLIIAPMSTRLKKTSQPTHSLIRYTKGLRAPSIVELEQIRTIDKTRIIDYIGRISKNQMADVERAARISLGLAMPDRIASM